MSITLRKVKPEEHPSPYNVETARGVRINEKNIVSVANHFGAFPIIQEVIVESKVSASGDESGQKIRFKIKGVGWRVAKVGDVVLREGVKPYHILIRGPKAFAGFIN
jgi:hypothetical protein